MNREDIEEFQQRIMPYLERHDDKKELETVCRMAVALADAIENGDAMQSDSETCRATRGHVNNPDTGDSNKLLP